MTIAPTFIANVVTVLALALDFFDIKVAPEQLQTTVTVLLIIGTPIFTMMRQVMTGRSTPFGTRPQS